LTSLKLRHTALEQLKSFQPDQKLIQKLKGKIIAIKVGGNALTDDSVKDQIVSQIVVLQYYGLKPVVIHGGGIEIKELLKQVGIKSEFIGGHRKTDSASMTFIEMALSGRVNKEIVRRISRLGIPAIGISGKDGNLVIAKKRVHSEIINGISTERDLGYVGDVADINPEIIHHLINSGYLPVISPVSMGADGHTYNINADMFAGHLASAIGAEKFIAITNIDGLLMDLDDPASLIENLTPESCRKLYGTVIQGGMIPKMDACLLAIENGVKQAHIINGMKQVSLLRILLTKDKLGTILSID
jgi:acetylglutamate kinase